ncbi:reverse transcriptase [Trichonephila clavipes]|nr:reverse transcriptase [Trichonephila clavipes]
MVQPAVRKLIGRRKNATNYDATDSLQTIQCHTKIAQLISYGWTVVLHWVPGNQRVDQKAKQGAESSQVKVSLTLRRAKSMINTCIDKCTVMIQKTKSLVMPWRNPGHCGSFPEASGESRGRSRFRLTTRHYFLEVYLYCLGLADDGTPSSAAMLGWMVSEWHCSATRRLLATDHVISNHGQVTWTPELGSPPLTTTPHQREDV